MRRAPPVATSSPSNERQLAGRVGPRIPHARAVLGLLCAAQFLIVVDFSIVTVAAPSAARALGMRDEDLQWLFTAYALSFGGLLLFGGRVGDVIGYRRALVLGLTLFTAASLLGGFAPTGLVLILARAAQGAGAALAAPAALALIVSVFERPDERTRALSAYGAVLSIGFVMGAVAGAVLTGAFGWRWVFFATVPVSGVAAIASARVLPPGRNRSAAGLNMLGAALATSALIATTYGVSTLAGEARTGSAAPLWFGLASVLGAAFVVSERRSATPLVPSILLRERSFILANVAAWMTVTTGVATIYALTVYLQAVAGLTPLVTGLILCGYGTAALLSSAAARRLVEPLGARRMLAYGLLLQGAGAATLLNLESHGSLGTVATGSALLGLGHVPAAIAYTLIAARSSPERFRGVAAGLLNTSQQLGAGLGLAVLVAFAEWRAPSVPHAGNDAWRNLAEVHAIVGAAAAVSLLGALVVGGRCSDRG